MISFTCPCGAALHVQDECAGQATRCPQCGREVSVPGAQGVPTAGRPPSVSRRAVLSAILGVLAVALSCGEALLFVMTMEGAGIIQLALIGCSFLAGLAAIVLANRVRGPFDRSRARQWSKRLARLGIAVGILNLILLLGVALVLPGILLVRQAAFRIQAGLNLYTIGLAMHSYHHRTGTFPPAAICDEQGKPLLSWRVALLPYIGQQKLYEQFKLDEPWDGPNNSKLLPLMPKEYALAIASSTPPGHTYFRVFVGNGAAFEPDRGVPLDEFTDGPHNTILVVEAATAVPWTKPEELPYDPNGPLPALGGHFRGRFGVIRGDGSDFFAPNDISQQTLRAAITRNGGEPMGPDW